eukprot:6777042-Prymnesium_polylepis.1
MCDPRARLAGRDVERTHLRGERRDPRGMSRTGQHRGGVLRAWRDVRACVRCLPANPPRGLREVTVAVSAASRTVCAFEQK